MTQQEINDYNKRCLKLKKLKKILCHISDVHPI
jgi:hypothetical protein